jgi:hypothetical protein
VALKIKFASFVKLPGASRNPNHVRVRGAKKKGFVVDGNHLPGTDAVFASESIFYIGSVTYSSAASEPAFDFDTPLSSRLLAIFASGFDDCSSSGAEEAVSRAAEGCESPPSGVRRVSPMTPDGFVSGSTPSLLATVAFLRFTKRTDETIARSAIEMAITPYATESIV